MVACVDPRRQKDQIYKACVIGREDYAIPNSVLRVNHPVRLIDPDASNNSSSSHPLEFLPKEEYDKHEPNPNAATIHPGRPWAYTVWKNALLLTDLPDRAYRLEINIGGEAAPMVEADDETIFAPTWDETIKAGALSRLYLGIEQRDAAIGWQEIYRYGFAGTKDAITGGLELLKRLNDQVDKAPLIAPYRDF